MKVGNKVISNNGNKGEITEITNNRINIRYESGNETNININKFDKMFVVLK